MGSYKWLLRMVAIIITHISGLLTPLIATLNPIGLEGTLLINPTHTYPV